MGFISEIPKLLALYATDPSKGGGDGEEDGSGGGGTTSSSEPTTMPGGAAVAAVSHLAGGIASLMPPILSKQRAVNILCLLEAVQLLVSACSSGGRCRFQLAVLLLAPPLILIPLTLIHDPTSVRLSPLLPPPPTTSKPKSSPT